MAQKILAFAGSLRSGSFNKKLVRIAAEGARAAGAEVTEVDLRDIPMPLFDGDIEHEQGLPPNAKLFKRLLIEHKGILISSPEYNTAMTAVLKNAIDWASRPPEQPFDGKPIGVMGASAGAMGTGRAQYHLRQCFVFLNGLVMTRPEVMIPAAQNKFDAEGKLTDQATRDFIIAHLAAFKAWVLRLK